MFVLPTRFDWIAQLFLASIRILVGMIIAIHGLEVFEKDKIQMYAQWVADRHWPFPLLMAYMGKGVELAGGILLALGLFTRMSALLLACTMAYITFVLGSGKIVMDDRDPFLFMLVFIRYFIEGPGKWSLDRWMFGAQKSPGLNQGSV